MVLHLDHIQPVSKGGNNTVLNYITACQECNSGKSNRLLSDNSVVTKQKQQLDDLQERREQLEMMMEWHSCLKSIEKDSLDIAVNAINTALNGFSVKEERRKDVQKLVKQYGLNAVLEAVDTAETQYLELGEDGSATRESAEMTYKKIGGILRVQAQPEWKKDLYYCRGILRNRVSYCNDWKAMEILEDAYNEGVSVEHLRNIVTTCKNWTAFQDQVSQAIVEVNP